MEHELTAQSTGPAAALHLCSSKQSPESWARGGPCGVKRAVFVIIFVLPFITLLNLFFLLRQPSPRQHTRRFSSCVSTVLCKKKIHFKKKLHKTLNFSSDETHYKAVEQCALSECLSQVMETLLSFS